MRNNSAEDTDVSCNSVFQMSDMHHISESYMRKGSEGKTRERHLETQRGNCSDLRNYMVSSSLEHAAIPLRSPLSISQRPAWVVLAIPVCTVGYVHVMRMGQILQDLSIVPSSKDTVTDIANGREPN
eukprot:5381852-Amphidinium_carterae.3